MKRLTNGFRSRAKLADHFQRHGRGCYALTEADYEQKADWFLGCAPTQSMLTARRPQGDTVRYDTATTEFGCLAHDGYIRTYLVYGDYARGLSYFHRQLTRVYR